jgi:hypothetical protein
MVLTLPIEKRWFELIRSGEKKEEYREIKRHWVVRMLSFKEDMEWQVLEEMLCDMQDPTRRHRDLDEMLHYYGVRFAPFSHVRLINGYRAGAPRILVPCGGITIGRGRPEWGAPPDRNVFIVRLGE